MNRPKSIWVLLGGPSSEREVSLRTGRGVEAALKSKGFEVTAHDVRPGKSLRSLDWTHPPDIVFLALHGAFGEDGTVQGFLESLGIPYTGSGVFSSALSMHKALSKRQLEFAQVPVPQGYEFVGRAGLNKLLENLPSSPDFFDRKWFIKPSREGSTIGIERYDPSGIIKPQAHFEELCVKALGFDECVLVEEWIEGPELTIPILFGKALPVIEIRPLQHFYDYESKYTKGKTEYLCPAPLTESDTKLVQSISEQTFVALECEDYGRVDIMLGADGPRVLEMNTLPGMTETSLVPKSAAAAGMDYATFCETLVCGSYERQQSESAK